MVWVPQASWILQCIENERDLLFESCNILLKTKIIDCHILFYLYWLILSYFLACSLGELAFLKPVWDVIGIENHQSNNMQLCNDVVTLHTAYSCSTILPPFIHTKGNWIHFDIKCVFRSLPKTEINGAAAASWSQFTWEGLAFVSLFLFLLPYSFF